MTDQQTVLLFAGAGASKAVSPDKYPTTIEFFKGLPRDVREDTLFRQVEDFLRQEVGDDAIDIELVLWRLEELRIFCRQVTDKGKIPGWILANDKLASVVTGRKTNASEVIEVCRESLGRLNQLVGKIDKRVYDLYGKLPDSNELEGTWVPLLEGIDALGVTVEIVTTNYDMVLEAALDQNQVVDIGWRGSVMRALDAGLWMGGRAERKRGLLTKLHGSVNWRRKDDRILVSDPYFKGDHKDHVIIYPGFKGRPEDGTFLSFHNHFSAALDRSRVALFVGFAFRDSYINEICERGRRHKLRVGIINPESNIDFPFQDTDVRHWESPFDLSSVNEALKFVAEAIKEK